MRRIIVATAALLAIAACGSDDEEAEVAPPAVIARLDGPAIGRVGRPIVLDATGSSGVGELEYEWAIEGPSADAALPETKGRREVLLVPDLVGDWSVNLQVRDGLGRVAVDSLSIRVSSLPIAVPGPDQLVHAGDTVVLDGSASRDPAGLALSYRWVAYTTPSASKLAVEVGDTDVTTFVADVPGTFEILLAVDNGHDVATAIATIVALE